MERTSSLGVTSEPLLGNDRAGVSNRSAEMTELLIVRVTFVLVIGYSRSSMELWTEKEGRNKKLGVKTAGRSGSSKD